MRLTLAGGSPGADASLLAVPRRTALLGAYTATTIVAGFGALAVATAMLLVSPDAGLRSDIAIGGLDGSVSGAAGVAVWILYALAGGTRMLRDPGGHATLTFHLPFIAAATILGGPVAGAWVAALGTVDRRELREAPWYGVLANHASLILAAFAGGLVFEGAVGLAGAVGDRRQPRGAARRRARRHGRPGDRLGAPRGGRRRPARRPRACGHARAHEPLLPADRGGGDDPGLGVRRRLGRRRLVGARPAAPWSCSPCGARPRMRRRSITTR